MRIRAHNHRFNEATGVAMVQLEVRHLMGSHFETYHGRLKAWKDWDGKWVTHKKRLKVLNRTWAKLAARSLEEDHHGPKPA